MNKQHLNNKRSIFFILGTALSMLSTAIAYAAPVDRPPLFAQLLGGNEVSSTGQAGAGSAGGYGSATVILKTPNILCFGLLVSNLDKPTAAHIHKGHAGENGPVVVPLIQPTTGNPGSSSKCITVEVAKFADISANPSGFYVNVHTGNFPSGAMRGQLF